MANTDQPVPPAAAAAISEQTGEYPNVTVSEPSQLDTQPNNRPKSQPQKRGPGTAERKCPNCSGANVRRSRRRGFVEGYLLRAVFLAPYRCQECDKRFYAPNGRKRQAPALSA